MTTVYLGLGANLGDPIQQLIDARQQLADIRGVSQIRCSSFYVSSPVGYLDQSDFVNSVVELCGDFELRSFFSELQKIEHRLGRVRDANNQNAARLIDIDLLLFGDQSINSVDLIVPHPRLTQRLFVLQPLMELAPELQIMGGRSIAKLLQEGDFSGQEIIKLGG